ncbi:MAG: M48 family metalloprotease [Deltaproteobacteria bacterium]|nr:M48 family metalloprotease [Deltaproteobacteria bacterium]
MKRIQSYLVYHPIAACVFGAILLLLAVGCATNPATQKRELMLVSQEKEFQIGQRVDKQVREEMGIYLELPKLREKVKQVVTKLGKHSHRPDVIYRVEIIDTPDFNAFAVPGGFLYVHRGLLERVNSTDEMASVLSHEIAHVAARHSAAQISKMQLYNIGLLGLSIATGGGAQDFAPLINLGGALAFNKFSRDAEREADRFGVEYMTQAGFNPNAGIRLMEQIQRLNDREPSAFDTWFLTHPPPSERIANLKQEINAMPGKDTATARPLERNEYIALLDGLAVGQWNGRELVSADRYINKEFSLSIPIPVGWQARINSKKETAIFFDRPKEAFAHFNIQPLRKQLTSATWFSSLSSKISKSGFQKTNESIGPPLAHGALSAIFKGNSSRLGPVRLLLFAFTKNNSGFSLVAVAKENAFTTLKPLSIEMINAMRFLSQAEVSEISPPRMKIHTVRTGETWGSITKRYYTNTQELNKLADYNGLTANSAPAPGMMLKIPPTLRMR